MLALRSDPPTQQINAMCHHKLNKILVRHSKNQPRIFSLFFIHQSDAKVKTIYIYIYIYIY